MADSSKICMFTQTTDSCALASYAISANYYTGIQIRMFFDDYCKHYNIRKFNSHKYLFGTSKITKEKISELAYDSHFHEVCKNSGMTGLEFIKNLHDYSNQISFSKSRKIFSLSYYSESKLHKHFHCIQQKLIQKNSLLIAAFIQGRHIAVFGFDKDEGWFTVETRPNNNESTQFIPSIQKYCTVGDGLMVFKINQIKSQPVASADC